jgi:acyl carrier protein
MSNEPQDDLMSAIAGVFAPVEVSPHSTFDELGATSVSLLRLMVAIQSRFNVVLDVVDMFSVDEVGGLIRLVEQRSTRSGPAPT